MTDLTQALVELRRVTPPSSPWEAGDFGVGSTPVDYHIATILNAALSGDLIPKADADLAVALMVEKAATITEAAKELAEYASYAEIVGGLTVNRPQVREWCDKVFGAIRALPEDENYERSFCALVPASAMAELQELREELVRLQTDITTYQQIVADMTQEAELATLRAQVERLTVKPLLFSELVDGGCMGRPHQFQYFITQNHNGRFLCHWDETWHDTLPEAQAHAQNDYQIAALTEGAAP